MSAGILATVGLYVGCQGSLDEIIPKPDMAMTLDAAPSVDSMPGVDMGPPTYVADVEPVIQASCALSNCHATGGNAPTFIVGATGADLMTNYMTFNSNSNTGAPMNSDMLTYPLGMNGHGGSKVFTMGTADPRYMTWLAYIAGGEVFQ
ncbi:MAG: hypothetical protein ABI321_23360 [Polyangia bacterium]